MKQSPSTASGPAPTHGPRSPPVDALLPVWVQRRAARAGLAHANSRSALPERTAVMRRTPLPHGAGEAAQAGIQSTPIACSSYTDVENYKGECRGRRRKRARWVGGHLSRHNLALPNSLLANPGPLQAIGPEARDKRHAEIRGPFVTAPKCAERRA